MRSACLNPGMLEFAAIFSTVAYNGSSNGVVRYRDSSTANGTRGGSAAKNGISGGASGTNGSPGMWLAVVERVELEGAF
ncbi:hypothetical protein BCR44DRAFT_1425380 [Catenaria anguillulae PL171]|uniref:Uncharacterized protein n=1 Tax=Catenaria anguillulae PL171 TaxID=765915 RepID=A0A1Y2I1J4_9FUNG|nr:hypothetical protein BCR44DRAFT_1425380 [Catenaria anguillulae PL171]